MVPFLILLIFTSLYTVDRAYGQNYNWYSENMGQQEDNLYNPYSMKPGNEIKTNKHVSKKLPEYSYYVGENTNEEDFTSNKDTKKPYYKVDEPILNYKTGVNANSKVAQVEQPSVNFVTLNSLWNKTPKQLPRTKESHSTLITEESEVKKRPNKLRNPTKGSFHMVDEPILNYETGVDADSEVAQVEHPKVNFVSLNSLWNKTPKKIPRTKESYKTLSPEEQSYSLVQTISRVDKKMSSIIYLLSHLVNLTREQRGLAMYPTISTFKSSKKNCNELDGY